MKFSELWLREWVNPKLSTAELVEVLTMAGLEVESIEAVAGDFDNTVVGWVRRVEPHPDADKLNVCSVDVGAAQALQIVCGAPNVVVGMKAPVARVGATLPTGLKIKQAKLRGVESFGMLCSAKELGMAESAEGLMVLPDDAPPGKDIRDYFWLNDQSIELGLTPNRGDCLSIAGIAREVGALCKTAVTEDAADTVPVQSERRSAASVEASEDCPRYLCQVIEDIDPAATTPLWIQEALRRSGLRSLGPVVDVTNFVLLELGQPLHAFDLDKLNGGLCVRHAQQGESLTLLDGQQIALETGTLVIADEAAPVALAGIMGGVDSAVSDTTTAIVLESAFFNPLNIMGRARRYGLHTDSSHRFERGVDPQLQRRAIERAAGLLLKIVGGRAGSVVEVVHEAALPVRDTITLRSARIERILGQAVPDEEVADILRRLGMRVVSDVNGWQVAAPSSRFDIEIEVDLIEEVARVHGYGRLPMSLPRGDARMQPCPEKQVPLSRLQQVLLSRGYQEAITYSFVEPGLQRLLDPEQVPVALANPISADLSVMRTSHWPGLVQALMHNLNRQQSLVRLFESGLRFIRQHNDIKQESFLSGVVAGSLLPEQWGEKSRPVDFFDVKNDVQALLASVAPVEGFCFQSEPHPALHSGQSAVILTLAGEPAGWIGALHPMVEETLELTQRVFVFELALKCFENARIPQFQPLSKYPAVRRDLAVVVDKEVTLEVLKKTVHAAATELLENFQLFDVYQGKGIDSGRKSIAFGLTFQDQSRTLQDVDVEAALAPILSALYKQLGATLRD
jgi:phenylalanyl-tRNA synthetase beta chain